MWTKIDDGWTPINKIFTENSGNWQEVSKVYTKINAAWSQVFPAVAPVACPTPGTYILAPTSLSLPTNGEFGSAEFNTTSFQFSGCIKQLSIILTWKNQPGVVVSRINVSGRPNNNFYREIVNNLSEWDGRTITHRIDTFDATSLTDFNSGAAIGYNLQSVLFGSALQGIGEIVTNVQCQMVT